MPPAPRAWDLVGRAQAALALASGFDGAARDRLPLPCRAAWLPFGSQAVSFAASSLPPGVVVLTGPAGTVFAGPAAMLREAAGALPGPVGRELRALLDRYERPVSRLRFADGTTWDAADGPRVMGILNVTPDSFSDGGRHLDPAAALDRATRMLDEGADILDIGAESTRPGAAPVDPAEERRRLLPVLAGLKRRFPGVRVSVDTRRAAVAAAALAEGADLVNDVSGLDDPEMAALVAAAGVPACIMHMRGTPETMQRHTAYDDVLGDVLGGLAGRVERARDAGIADDRILVDPGIGFAKSAEGNLALLAQLRSFRSLGLPVLVGASRKAFIGALTGVADPAERVFGSVAVAALAARDGAAVIRVHDVGPTRQALAIARALTPREGEGDR